ncbi:hypothetical protein QLL95_gp0382 [Cotonvirus japonicus]|uniref:Bro-N domain-containing protein n=1 Tax=Cotonvirus japonicus TaxID=2811091 RepID=A0ABM7NUJ4_9VIRU|nr:hypothetical protein QLL95_gp0382 [Cotonvirus japonicus]BCS83741.1 hypothetical protein [Cotonvirus japonicus]
MDTLTKIKIVGKEYYHTDDILKLKIQEFKKCTNGRQLVGKIKIEEKDYIYAANKNGKWIKTNGNSRKFDKVFIKVSWLEEYVNNSNNEYSEEENENSDSENEEENNDSENEEEINDLENKEIITMAPGIIKLTKKEKIKDDKNKIIEIEVRGTRDPKNIYFKASDVSKGFNLLNLCDILTKKNTKYEEGKDYKYFYLENTPNNLRGNKKIKDKKPLKRIFLTYEGLIRVMYVSRSNRASKFLYWATETLFTAHLGTKEQKTMLCSKLMGINAEIVKEVFNKTSSTLPVCYLFTIGKVKDLRATLDIDKKYDDESTVAKLGETIDLTRRIDEHIETFGKMPGAKLCLKWYNYLDPQFTSKAETELKTTFKKMNFTMEHPDHKEIIIFSKVDTKTVIDQFDNVSRKYTGHITEISNKLTDMNHEIEKLKLQHSMEINKLTLEKRIMELEMKDELKTKNKIIDDKDKIIAKKNKIIKEKDEIIHKQIKKISNLEKKLI